jgi:Arc/MetJ-type ribon-helix-helix transcriptional regulator
MPTVPSSRRVVARPPEAEKITINLGFVDLGQIDLLVAEGFYGNRSDLIRTAIRNQLGAHADVVRALQASQQRLNIRALGLVTIASDVSPALAHATIESIDVLGALHASPAVKAALAHRMR